MNTPINDESPEIVREILSLVTSPREIMRLHDIFQLARPPQYYLDPRASILRCTISMETGERSVLGPRAHFNKAAERLYDFAHELCHFRLGETRDPLFVTAMMEPESPSNDLVERMQYLQISRLFEDIWVDDVMMEIVPDIKIAHTREIWDMTQKILLSRDYKYFDTPYALIITALNIAERTRHEITGMRQIEKQVLTQLEMIKGKQWVKNLKKYSEFIKSCPALPTDPQTAMRIYSEKIQESINFFGFPIQSKIVSNNHLPDHIPHLWRITRK